MLDTFSYSEKRVNMKVLIILPDIKFRDRYLQKLGLKLIRVSFRFRYRTTDLL